MDMYDFLANAAQVTGGALLCAVVVFTFRWALFKYFDKPDAQ